jgi:hypothetical protein
MRKRKSNITADNANIISFELIQKISQMTNKINSLQMEIDIKEHKLEKLNKTIVEYNNELGKILISIKEQDVKLKNDRDKNNLEIENAKNATRKDIDKQYKHLEEKQREFLIKEQNQTMLIKITNDKIDENNRKIAEQNKIIKEKLQDLTLGEEFYVIAKNRALQEQEIIKSLLKRLDKEKEDILDREKQLSKNGDNLEKQIINYQINMEQLIADKSEFENKKQYILKKDENFKTREINISEKNKELDKREMDIITRERAIDIKQKELLKKEKDLELIQIDLINAKVKKTTK